MEQTVDGGDRAEVGTWAAGLRYCAAHDLRVPVGGQPAVGLEGAGGPRRSRLLCVLLAQREALSEYRPLVSQAHQLQRRTSAADKKLALIPLIFVCLRIWSTVRFVLTLCGSPAVRTPVLVVLHVGLPRPRPALAAPGPPRGQQGQIPVPGRQAGRRGALPHLALLAAPQGALMREDGRSAWLGGSPGVLSCCPVA